MNLPVKPTILENVTLSPFTTIKIGGPAKFFCTVISVEELISAIDWAQTNTVKFIVLGGGSSVVISDDGFDGLVIKMGIRGQEILNSGPDGIFIKSYAGEIWDDFVKYTVENNWAGVECLSSIPGTVGAAPIQNIGAYGQEVKDTITEVEVLNTLNLQIEKLSNTQCGFTYRNSVFKQKPGKIVVSITFKLIPEGEPTLKYKPLQDAFGGKIPSLKEVRNEVIQIRKSKSMVIDPKDLNSVSVGSFFINPIIDHKKLEKLKKKQGNAIPSWKTENGTYKLAAAWLIEQSGFNKGYSYKNVGISQNHALALINKGKGNSKELLDLANQIMSKVKSDFGVKLEIEPQLLGFE